MDMRHQSLACDLNERFGMILKVEIGYDYTQTDTDPNYEIPRLEPVSQNSQEHKLHGYVKICSLCCIKMT